MTNVFTSGVGASVGFGGGGGGTRVGGTLVCGARGRPSTGLGGMGAGCGVAASSQSRLLGARQEPTRDAGHSRVQPLANHLPRDNAYVVPTVMMSWIGSPNRQHPRLNAHTVSAPAAR